MIVPIRHKSFDEVFQARVYSPISRLREGILCGPKIGDHGITKEKAFLVIGLDGSISVVKSIREDSFEAVEWFVEHLPQIIDNPPLFQPGKPNAFVFLIFRTYFKIIQIGYQYGLLCIFGWKNENRD